MFIELTLRNHIIDEKIVHTIRTFPASITAIGLTDKNGMPNNLELISQLKKEFPKIQFVPYYSLKNHTNRDPQVIRDNFEMYIETSKNQELEHILLVSGNPKPKFETLPSLNYINDRESSESMKFGVAYNPFLSGDELQQENERLEKKLDFPMVNSVYLQIGFDEKKLQEAVTFIKKIRPKINIIASIFVPTPYTLSKFEFRPWKGVFLPEGFTTNYENSLKMCKKYLDFSTSLGLTPLFSINSLTNQTIEAFTKLTT
jgi:5,10-methylenetetrahydrofolate reductase